MSYDKSLIHFFIGHDSNRELFILQRLLQHKTSSLDDTLRTYSNMQSHSKFDKCSQPCQNEIKRNQVLRLYFRYFFVHAQRIEHLTITESHNDSKNQQRIKSNRTSVLGRTAA